MGGSPGNFLIGTGSEGCSIYIDVLGIPPVCSVPQNEEDEAG